jgi:hypothetical protein
VQREKRDLAAAEQLLREMDSLPGVILIEFSSGCSFELVRPETGVKAKLGRPDHRRATDLAAAEPLCPCYPRTWTLEVSRETLGSRHGCRTRASIKPRQAAM